MAQRLIERWHLAVLVVRLDVTRRTPLVVTELVDYQDGSPRTFWQERYEPAKFGLPDGTAAPTALRVPRDLRKAVREFTRKNRRRDVALWLRLVPPYGYLGAVPWEEDLVPVTGAPVVRVPDRLPVATDPGRVWNVAIAISARPGSGWAAPYVGALVPALHRAVDARIDVDVFADGATYLDIRAMLDETARTGAAVRVHDPGNARQAYQVRSSFRIGQDRSPRTRLRASALQPGLLWRDWITAGLAGRAVRALHVVADAVFDADHPMLAVSQDPTRPADPASRAYVGAEDVRILADVIGAGALSFGSPPDNSSDVATRVMADAVGQQRPGATLYSSIGRDPAGYALAGAHAFIVRNGYSDYGALRVLHDPSLFAYLQPKLVSRSLVLRSPYDEPPPNVNAAPDREVRSYYAQADVLPTWLAATERYIESSAASLAVTSASADEGNLTSTKRAYEQGAEEALAELRALTTRHMRQS
jgi:hypothetical protein